VYSRVNQHGSAPEGREGSRQEEKREARLAHASACTHRLCDEKEARKLLLVALSPEQPKNFSEGLDAPHVRCCALGRWRPRRGRDSVHHAKTCDLCSSYMRILQLFDLVTVVGALCPSKSGLMNKHIVKHIVVHDDISTRGKKIQWKKKWKDSSLSVCIPAVASQT
jgi:hypothetical protein